jgi:crotonobetainyl-CoA:carnitine CoA-transferase CaiB-like acyl-CoA transferase
MRDMSEPHGPLQGVRVVACSTAQAGTVPYMLMADLGAEVIKIEVPEIGDNSRGSTVLPGFPSTYFETNNRGVKSLTLNLKTEEGRDILKKLVARADMFGQNFRPGAAEKNGFGYDELRRVNPKLVYISISGGRSERAERAFAGHRFDGAGFGRHRAGLCDTRSAAKDRHRLGRR